MKTFIEFGGFYDSYHSSMIESYIESFEYEGYSEYNFSNINWQETYQSYIESYCYNLERYISYQYDINIDFKNITLWSPREYNFRNDEIDCIVNEKQSLKLLKLVLKNDDFHKRLKEVTTSRSGYIPYYTYEQLLNMKDNMILGIMFSFIADRFNSDTCNLADIEYEIKLISYEVA